MRPLALAERVLEQTAVCLGHGQELDAHARGCVPIRKAPHPSHPGLSRQGGGGARGMKFEGQGFPGLEEHVRAEEGAARGKVRAFMLIAGFWLACADRANRPVSPSTFTHPPAPA